MKFAYSTLQSARNFGISTTDMDDTTVQSLIPVYSERVNSICGQIFAPEQKTIRMSIADAGVAFVKIPSGSPVLAVNSVDFIDPTGTVYAITSVNYEVVDDFWLHFYVSADTDIDLAIIKSWYYDSYTVDYELYQDIYLRNSVSARQMNLSTNCYVGNLTNKKQVVVTLTSQIATGMTSFTLLDASQIEPRDMLVFGNNVFIANSIDYTSNTVYIDPAPNIPPITSGTQTTVWGSAPYQIEEVINLFLKNHDYLSDSIGGNFRRNRIGRNYQWESTGNTMGITGINEIDSILYTFMRDEFEAEYL